MALANTMKLARFANGPLARNMASLATTGFKQCLLNTPPTQVQDVSTAQGVMLAFPGDRA